MLLSHGCNCSNIVTDSCTSFPDLSFEFHFRVRSFRRAFDKRNFGQRGGSRRSRRANESFHAGFLGARDADGRWKVAVVFGRGDHGFVRVLVSREDLAWVVVPRADGEQGVEGDGELKVLWVCQPG